GRARLCHGVPSRAYRCHTAALVASRWPRGRARACHRVPGCDQGHCTLDCTLSRSTLAAVRADAAGQAEVQVHPSAGPATVAGRLRAEARGGTSSAWGPRPPAPPPPPPLLPPPPARSPACPRLAARCPLVLDPTPPPRRAGQGAPPADDQYMRVAGSIHEESR